MIQANIVDFKAGWFVGDFEPSIFKNPFFEVAHHSHTKGQQTFPHYHAVTNELNYIICEIFPYTHLTARKSFNNSQ